MRENLATCRYLYDTDSQLLASMGLASMGPAVCFLYFLYSRLAPSVGISKADTTQAARYPSSLAEHARQQENMSCKHVLTQDIYIRAKPSHLHIRHLEQGED